MNFRIIALLFFIINITFVSSNVKIGIISNENPLQSQEINAIKRLLSGSSESITLETVSLAKNDYSKFDILWYHRPDSGTVTSTEKQFGKGMKEYVENGGNLLLTLDAVRLLNDWGIESTPIKANYYKAYDYGFGRNAGFHAYREHPLFENLFGGAYTWHGKTDNQVRINGFFDDERPAAENSKSIGIFWQYIFYKPDQIVIWETPIGKGKILAIGTALYYTKENFHSKILEQFTYNTIHYLDKNNITFTKARYWENNTQPDVILSKSNYPKVNLSKSSRWELPADQMKLGREATSFYADLPTKRALIVASEVSGIEEIWTHPFLSLRDLNTHIQIEGVDTITPLINYRPYFEIRPNALIRTYKIGKIELQEIITADIEKPSTLIHFQWKGGGIKNIIVDYVVNNRFMWPYDEKALGNIYYQWSSELNGFIVSDKENEFNSIVGSNKKGKLLAAGRYNGFTYNGNSATGKPTELLQVCASLSFSTSNDNNIDLVLTASDEGVKTSVADYQDALKSPKQIFDSSAEYYENYLSKVTMITTPDATLNEGYRWAVLSSIQFLVNTPGVGESLMAGYSSSRRGWGGNQKVSGRPGYAWYFGRDAVWAGFAFNKMGDFETVRKVLDMLIQYQQVDGKIYHELTTSGSVHYDASDATPMFVILMAEYLRASGDINYINANMQAVHKAMEYCYSTDTDGDGLIEVANVGHGWLEGGELFGSQTEFYLCGLWNKALIEAAFLSKFTQDDKFEKKYTNDAKKVNETINNDFWNEKGYFNYGKRKDGTFTDRMITLVNVPILMGVTDVSKGKKTVDLFAKSGYSSDWGVRTINDTTSIRDGGAYHPANIWPLQTGWVSLADYKVGRYNQGYTHMMSNLQSYKVFSLGRISEVINGTELKTSGITLHQCWSETMVIQPMLEGMLGIQQNILDNSLTLSPHIQIDWNEYSVQNILVGKSASVDMSMQKFKDKIRYTIHTNNPLKINFNPSFALGSKIKKVNVNNQKQSFETEQEDEAIKLKMSFDVSNQAVIDIYYDEGVYVFPSTTYPELDALTSGFRILGYRLNSNTLEINLEGRPNHEYPLNIYLPKGYKKIDGVDRTLSKIKDKTYSIKIPFGQSNEKYITKKIRIEL